MADLTQIGIGGALALLIIERVFSFVQKFSGGKPTNEPQHGTNGKSGNQPISFWERTFERASYESSCRAVREHVPGIMRDCLKDHDEKVRRPDLEEAAQERRDLLRQIEDLKRQVANGIAEIARQVRDR